jgi:hypothetical protein
MAIADVLDITDLDEELFSPQTKQQVIDFIQNGRPSQTYLEKIMDILENNGVDTSEILTPIETPDSPRSTDYSGAGDWVRREREAGRTSGLD